MTPRPGPGTRPPPRNQHDVGDSDGAPPATAASATSEPVNNAPGAAGPETGAGTGTPVGDDGAPRRPGGVSPTWTNAPWARMGASVGIPHVLSVAVGWSWRLLLVGVTAYAGVQVLALLHLVVVPLIAALLLTALLRPLTAMLRRVLPAVAAAGLTLVVAAAILAGVGYVVALRAAPQIPALVDQLLTTVHQIRDALATSTSSAAGRSQLLGIDTTITNWLHSNRGQAVAIATTGAGYLFEFATSLVLTLFITFFLLSDGERIWSWLLTPFTSRARTRTDRAGHRAWTALGGYIRGTAVIAVVHTVVIGVTLLLLGTPLPLPLAILVFIGSFIPIIGTLVAGGIAALVTLSALGWVPTLILLAVIAVEDQLEAHLYQPMIVGRYVRLHPLAIGLALVIGTVLAGIIGAIIAVPLAAVVHRAWPALLGHDQAEP